MEEYISLHVQKRNTRRRMIKPTEEVCVMRAGFKERETAFAGSFKRWKELGGRRDPGAGMHTSFMDKPFVRSHDEVEYKSRLESLMTQLSANGAVSEDVSIDLYCGGYDLCDKWFV